MKPKRPRHPEDARYAKAARAALGMSRDELAVAIGFASHSIGRWERGEYPVNKRARKDIDRLIEAKKNRRAGHGESVSS